MKDVSIFTFIYLPGILRVNCREHVGVEVSQEDVFVLMILILRTHRRTGGEDSAGVGHGGLRANLIH